MRRQLGKGFALEYGSQESGAQSRTFVAQTLVCRVPTFGTLVRAQRSRTSTRTKFSLGLA